MRFGERVRALREARELTQRELAVRLDVSSSYLSKIENEKLHFGDYPSEKFIHRLADVLDADESELLLLTERVPAALRQRICEHPDVFNAIANLDDAALEELKVELISRKVLTS